MARVYNFSAGPAMIPEPVLKKAAAEMVDYNGTGMSVMEMSHRSKPYEEIINGAEALLRELMNIPDTYHVLFLQGGASSQFAMVPMNLFSAQKKADYVETGEWAMKAIMELLMLLPVPKIRLFPIFPNLMHPSLIRMQTTFILQQITRFMEQNFLHYPIPGKYRLWLICRRIFSPRSMT